MSEVIKVLESRRSCRNFKPEPVSEDALNAIIEAGTYAAPRKENYVYRI